MISATAVWVLSIYNRHPNASPDWRLALPASVLAVLAIGLILLGSRRDPA